MQIFFQIFITTMDPLRIRNNQKLINKTKVKLDKYDILEHKTNFILSFLSLF